MMTRTLKLAMLSFLIPASLTLPVLSDELADKNAAYQATVERSLHQKGPVVYTVKRVARGAIFTAADVEARMVETRTIPQDSLTVVTLVIGRQALIDTPAGTRVTRQGIHAPKRAQ